MAKTKKPWSYQAGKRGARVRVYERGNVIHAAVWDEHSNSYHRWSLGHNDRERAEEQARELAEKRRRGLQVLAGATTIGMLTDEYEKAKLPTRKTEHTRSEVRRQAALWRNFPGRDFRVDRISRRELDDFAHKRFKGLIDARGNPVPDGQRRTVRKRSVECDLRALYAMLEWGTETKKPNGDWLVAENPMRRFKKKLFRNWTEHAPRRQIATREWYERVLAKAPEVHSYLLNALKIGRGTGRRINSILRLRANDYLPDVSEYGAIRWRGEYDKMGNETVTPVNAAVAEAIRAQRQAAAAVGDGWLFAHPKHPSKPISYNTLWKWLRRAERLAEVEHAPFSGFHALRRLWTTERKALPDVDVAKAGGWKNPNVMRLAYQHADDEGVKRAVMYTGKE